MKIKTSNKILLVAGAIPVLVLFLLLLTIRIMMPGNTLNAMGPQVIVGPQIVKTIELEGFNEISVNGPWRLHVIQRDRYKIEIKVPQQLVEKLIVEKRGNTLFIGENPGAMFQGGNKNLEATVIIPVVSKIDLNGVNSVDLSGINNDNLNISMQGVTTVTGLDSAIKDLSLKGKGVSTIDMTGVSVTNASVECNGTYTINLFMNGGRLSGRLDGIGNLNYRGYITSNEVLANSPVSSVVHLLN
jgi:hypothetical protein